MAAAYSMLEFQKSPTGMPLESYIWEIGNSMNNLILSRILCYNGFLKLIYDIMYVHICLSFCRKPQQARDDSATVLADALS